MEHHFDTHSNLIPAENDSTSQSVHETKAYQSVISVAVKCIETVYENDLATLNGRFLEKWLRTIEILTAWFQLFLAGTFRLRCAIVQGRQRINTAKLVSYRTKYRARIRSKQYMCIALCFTWTVLITQKGTKRGEKKCKHGIEASRNETRFNRFA